MQRELFHRCRGNGPLFWTVFQKQRERFFGAKCFVAREEEQLPPRSTAPAASGSRSQRESSCLREKLKFLSKCVCIRDMHVTHLDI
jgi:hypothetical protein